MLDINAKIKAVLDKVSTFGVGTFAGTITAFVDAIEVAFGMVGDLLGVINDNISRIKGLFSKKP